jgi:hypothetical protein
MYDTSENLWKEAIVFCHAGSQHPPARTEENNTKNLSGYSVSRSRHKSSISRISLAAVQRVFRYTVSPIDMAFWLSVYGLLSILFRNTTYVHCHYSEWPSLIHIQNNTWHSADTCFLYAKIWFLKYKTKTNSGALVRQRTIPTERPPFVGEVSAHFSG